MLVLRYQLHLKAPAIFSALDGEPNSAVSYDFIPGSAVRGMLIGQYMNHEKTTIDASNPQHRKLFFSGETRYLNAYPMIASERSLPIPLTWQKPKYNSQSQYIMDSAVSSEQSQDDTPKQKLTSLSGYTHINSDNTALIYKPKRAINVHTRRARRKSDEQQVFRYDAIASEQDFIGAIYCDDKDVQLFKDLFSAKKHVSMGGARSAGYGLMTLEFFDEKPNDWQEAPHDYNADKIILTFLSDTILRNKYGEYSTTPDAIENALPDGCKVVAKSIKHSIVGGFNRKWGLPLPQVPVILRGSVVEVTNFKGKEADFKKLTQDGIGEQRLDGFGRITINWQNQAELPYQSDDIDTKPEKQAMSDDSKDLWSQMRQRINERTVNERMVGIVFSDNYTIHSRLTLTQLSRLRAVIADELRTNKPSRSVLSDFIDGIAGKVAGRQFDDASIGNQRLSDWLKRPVFPELGQSLQERDKFVLQLVDAVLERAHKEKSLTSEASS